ncbi:hypothetical protein MRB53_027721 [Persea americana]|uniref:Uncharacterized protein n=1 Tax=Persea americana TaxID=3435 RepID=A0ACC2LM67_PERAE|nr:hypothetical protein MRB53_027721 [Persea americana]
MALKILKATPRSLLSHLFDRSFSKHLIPVFLISNPLLPSNPKPHFHTNTHPSINPPPPPTPQSAAFELSKLFSKHPSLRNTLELETLSQNLTPETVESVLKSLRGWRQAHEFFSWAALQDGFQHTCYTYNTMASILSRARQVPRLQTLVTDVVNCGCLMTPGALGFLIRCLGSVGLADDAEHLFENSRMVYCVPNNYTYNCLIEVLAKCGRVESAEMRCREMVDAGWEPDKFTLTPVLQAYCISGRFKQALDVFNRIHSRGWVDEHVFVVFLIFLSKLGEVDHAYELIERTGDTNLKLNKKTLCVLIHGFTREGRIDKAVLLFDKMKGLGFSGDLPLYSVLIKGLCERKEVKKALSLYSEMKEFDVFPDVILTAKLILSLCKEGDLITVKRLLQEDGRNLDADASVLLYNAVLEGLVYFGKVDEAHSLIWAMMKSQMEENTEEAVAECSVNETMAVVDSLLTLKDAVVPNAASFGIVIDGLCKMHKLDIALKLLHNMICMGCSGSLLIYNNLIHELCNEDRLEDGYKLLSEMKESGFEPTHFTYNSFFGCVCRRGNTSGALDLVREMRRHGHEPWIKHYTTLVKQLCVHGKLVEACGFLKDMVQVGIVPNIIAYSAAMDGLCKAGEVDQALKLFHEISANQYLPDVVAHNILIHGLCKAGRVSEAQGILNELLEKGLVPSVVTYNLMIDGWCKRKRIDLALLCFSKMVDNERPPTVITYTTLIDGLCNAGRPDDALGLWNDMKGKGCAPNKIAYMALVSGLCKCGQEDTALVYFHEMEAKEMDADSFVYVALINAFISKKESLMAFKLLKEMVQKTKFPSPTDKNYPLLIGDLHKLYEDKSISLDVESLIEGGCIPMIQNVRDLGLDGEN